MVKEIIDQLESIMKGLNYITAFCLEELGSANSNEAVRNRIKEKFPASEPFNTSMTEITEEELWKAIQFGFDFRGSKSAGLQLNKKEEGALKIHQERFKTELRKYFTQDTKFYKYASNTGIPYYVAMWGFSFVFNKEEQWFFLHGSASD